MHSLSTAFNENYYITKLTQCIITNTWKSTQIYTDELYV